MYTIKWKWYVVMYFVYLLFNRYKFYPGSNCISSDRCFDISYLWVVDRYRPKQKVFFSSLICHQVYNNCNFIQLWKVLFSQGISKIQTNVEFYACIQLIVQCLLYLHDLFSFFILIFLLRNFIEKYWTKVSEKSWCQFINRRHTR
jgi:hypothetical protein